MQEVNTAGLERCANYGSVCKDGWQVRINRAGKVCRCVCQVRGACLGMAGMEVVWEGRVRKKGLTK